MPVVNVLYRHMVCRMQFIRYEIWRTECNNILLFRALCYWAWWWRAGYELPSTELYSSVVWTVEYNAVRSMLAKKCSVQSGVLVSLVCLIELTTMLRVSGTYCSAHSCVFVSGMKCRLHKFNVPRKTVVSSFQLPLNPRSCFCFLFPKTQIQLMWWSFEVIAEIEAESQALLESIAVLEFQRCFRERGRRWNLCTKSEGGCFEGDNTDL
jgi:hypothetical protein